MLPEAAQRTALLLQTGGKAYGGWKAIRVTSSMLQCAGSFALGVSELWPGNDYTRSIQPGETCVVKIGEQPVITGHVDAVELSLDATQHEVAITGRDATADLVDCSAVRKAGQWRGQRIETIAADLCEPFKVKVRTEVDTGKPLPSFALQEGETVFEAIERAARIRALLLMSDGEGALVITRAGSDRVATPLVVGQNILAARATLDLRDRFRDYTVKGQAPGSDDFNGARVSQIAARASDYGIGRYRPLIITNDAPDLAATLTQRVKWEANVRAARSMDIQVKVQGWLHADGLWVPNRLVRVQGDALRLDDELLITEVDYVQDESGQTATLRLTRPDAYTTLPLNDAPGKKASPYWNTRKPEPKRVQAFDLNGPSFSDLSGGGP